MRLEMPVIVLKPKNQIIVEDTGSLGLVREVLVRDGDWYLARAVGLRWALREGAPAVGVITNFVETYHRPHGGVTTRTNLYTKHGMWMYLERLVRQFGHAYVPPLAWARFDTALTFGTFEPPIPLVAAYSTKALADVQDLNGPLGLPLCHQGHASFTVSDYFHYPLGNPDDVLAEHGTINQWKKAYDKAIETLLG